MFLPKRRLGTVLSLLLTLFLLVLLAACKTPSSSASATPTPNLRATAEAQDVTCDPGNPTPEKTVKYKTFNGEDISGICVLHITDVPLTTYSEILKDKPVKLLRGKGNYFWRNYGHAQGIAVEPSNISYRVMGGSDQYYPTAQLDTAVAYQVNIRFYWRTAKGSTLTTT